MTTKNENRYHWRGGQRDRSLRVGDREREAVGEMLREHHVEGRLDAEEFQERLERCLAAKTYRDLDQLVADFPTPAAERERVVRPPGWSLWRVAPLPLVLISLAVVAAIVLSAGHLVWLVFPLVFFVLRPLSWRSWGHGFGARGCGPRSSTRVERRA
jgi:hypothetical protein